MDAEHERVETAGEQRRPNAGWWLGLAAGAAALAWMTARSGKRYGRQRYGRRYADRGDERRNPLHFFLAGAYPRRRHIDRSGARPLFERRQSVYEAY